MDEQNNEVVEKTLKELKQELVELGMPQEQVDSFNTKAQLVAVIGTLKAKELVKRVNSLEEKENPVEKRQFDNQYRTKANIMRDHLMSQPMVRIMIPLEQGEAQGKVEWRTDKNGNKYQVCLTNVNNTIKVVQLNGFKYYIPRGVYTEVPEQIAKHIEEQQTALSNAGADILLDRIDPRTGRPYSDSM